MMMSVEMRKACDLLTYMNYTVIRYVCSSGHLLSHVHVHVLIIINRSFTEQVTFALKQH